MVIVAPVQAQRCWNQSLVEAAQVKEFDIMLLVATLRCQVKGVDLTAGYNAFVVAHKPVLKGVGDDMLREFNQTLGGKEALKAYDRMSVVMANKFGNGVEGLECTDYQMMITEAQAALPSSRTALLTLAQRAGVDPQLPVARCQPPVPVAAPAAASTAVVTAGN